MGVDTKSLKKFLDHKMITHTLILGFALVASAAGAGQPSGESWEAHLARLPVNRYTSALGVEELTALVLQYAMYDFEAQDHVGAGTLVNICRIYHKYRRGFVKLKGVEVTEAGTAHVNGWYRRREATEMPSIWMAGSRSFTDGPHRWHRWSSVTNGRPWYLKDDNHHIYWNKLVGFWLCCNADGHSYYMLETAGHFPRPGECRSERVQANRGGWCNSAHGETPAPFVRVVS